MADEEKPARKKMSEAGWAFFNVARSPGRGVGAIIKDPAGDYMFVDEYAMGGAVAEYGEESADVAKTALDAITEAQKKFHSLYRDPYVRRGPGH